jgi:hypothetical protein
MRLWRSLWGAKWNPIFNSWFSNSQMHLIGWIAYQEWTFQLPVHSLFWGRGGGVFVGHTIPDHSCGGSKWPPFGPPRVLRVDSIGVPAYKSFFDIRPTSMCTPRCADLDVVTSHRQLTNRLRAHHIHIGLTPKTESNYDCTLLIRPSSILKNIKLSTYMSHTQKKCKVSANSNGRDDPNKPMKTRLSTHIPRNPNVYRYVLHLAQEGTCKAPWA